MILKSINKAEVITSGVNEEDVVKMSIDTEDTGVLMSILSEGLYKDPVGSTIREWASNALDSHTEAGVKEPVIVEISRDNANAAWLQVTDFGVGISPERMEKVVKKYAASTKRHTDTLLGSFGLGLKSGLSYSDSFIFTTRFDGVEYQYIMYKGEDGTLIDKIYEQPTEERNGTTFKIKIKDWSDEREFRNKCAQQLCYFESVYFNIDGIRNDHKIIRSKNWKFSELNGDYNLHLSLDNVYYPIDFAKLGIKPIKLPIALNFSLGEGLIPIPSREDIKYNSISKALIMKKIEEIADEFVSQYNEKNQEANSFFDVYRNLNSAQFQINELNYSLDVIKEYSKLEIKPIKVKGIDVLDLKYLVSIYENALDEYEIRGKVYSSGSFTGKHTAGTGRVIRKALNPNIDDTIYILVDSAPKGVQLLYLKSLGKSIEFVYKKDKRKLNRENLYSNHRGRTLYKDHPNFGLYYYDLLNLKDIPKNKWREAILEYESIRDHFLPTLETVDKYTPTAEWLKQRKDNRAIGTKTVVTKEEINVKYARHSDIGYSIVFKESEVVDINVLHKTTKKLVVYGVKDDIEDLRAIFEMGSRNKRVTSVLLSTRDFNKLENKTIHNWISIKTFMEGNNKPFSVFTTSIRAKDLMLKYSDLFKFESVMRTIVPEICDKLKKIKEYVGENYVNISDPYLNSILETAKKHNYWDVSIIDDVLEIESIAPKFDFLSVLKVETTSRYGSELAPIGDKMSGFIIDLLKYRGVKLEWHNYNLPSVPVDQEIPVPENDYTGSEDILPEEDEEGIDEDVYDTEEENVEVDDLEETQVEQENQETEDNGEKSVPLAELNEYFI